MNPLDRVIANENAREILECLTGAELLVLQAMMSGWEKAEIAEHRGVSRCTINQQLRRARRRIILYLPELAAAIDGRVLLPERAHNHNGNGGKG